MTYRFICCTKILSTIDFFRKKKSILSQKRKKLMRLNWCRRWIDPRAKQHLVRSNTRQKTKEKKKNKLFSHTCMSVSV